MALSLAGWHWILACLGRLRGAPGAASSSVMPISIIPIGLSRTNRDLPGNAVQDPLGDLRRRERFVERNPATFAQAAEPGELPLGELPRPRFDQVDRFGEISPPFPMFQHFSVAQGLPGGAAEGFAGGQYGFNF